MCGRVDERRRRAGYLGQGVSNAMGSRRGLWQQEKRQDGRQGGVVIVMVKAMQSWVEGGSDDERVAFPARRQRA